MRKDMRRLNKVSKVQNRDGYWYVFGEYGTRKDATVTTLAYTGKGRRGGEKASKVLNSWRHEVGRVWDDVRKDRSKI
jgi:hypothetical protein